MCKYCEGEYGTELFIRNEKSVGIYAPESQLELLKEAGDGIGQIVIDSKKINYCSKCGQKITRKSELFISVKSFDKGRLNLCNIDCMFEYMREHDEYLLIGKVK